MPFYFSDAAHLVIFLLLTREAKQIVVRFISISPHSSGSRKLGGSSQCVLKEVTSQRSSKPFQE